MEVKIQKGTKVLIFGIGTHGGGRSVIRYCKRKKALIRVTDQRPISFFDATLPELNRIEGTFGTWKKADVLWADIIVQNPGVPPTHPLCAFALKHKKPVVSDIDLFLGEIGKQIDVAVTGTRGKSTTTMLISALLKTRYAVNVIGNIRIPALTTLPQKQSTLQVAELSSFQIDVLSSFFTPHVAVFTNLYPDHLNRYNSMRSYAASKQKLFLQQHKQDVSVLNFDDVKIRTFAKKLQTTIYFFSMKKLPRKYNGAFFHNNSFWIQKAFRKPMLVCNESDVALDGKHNVQNILAALAVASFYHVKKSSMRLVLSKVKGLPGRLEYLGRKKGVHFVNDTTSTMPIALLSAIQTLQQRFPLSSLHIIIGGADKKLTFSVLQRVNQKNIVWHALEGDATRQMKKYLHITKMHPHLQSAFRDAVASARPGDCIVLSPGAASFNMFTHEFERGDVFTHLVKKL